MNLNGFKMVVNHLDLCQQSEIDKLIENTNQSSLRIHMTSVLYEITKLILT